MKLEKINTSEAFRYLGYQNVLPDAQVMNLAGECEQELLAAIDGKYVYKYLKITNRNEDGIFLEGTSMVLTGTAVREHLADCEGVVLFAVTISETVDRLIRRYQAQQMSMAVITDAMASAAVEQLCGRAEEEIMRKFPQKYATWRFSPGYGDLPLSVQTDFLKVLDASRRIGIHMTEGGLMAPCKSVTALIGISEQKIEQSRKGCMVCSMRERCSFRKKGEHCGF